MECGRKELPSHLALASIAIALRAGLHTDQYRYPEGLSILRRQLPRFSNCVILWRYTVPGEALTGDIRIDGITRPADAEDLQDRYLRLAAPLLIPDIESERDTHIANVASAVPTVRSGKMKSKPACLSPRQIASSNLRFTVRWETGDAVASAPIEYLHGLIRG